MLNNNKTRLSLGVSIVLYKTPLERIGPLLSDLEEGGASHLYVIDNTPGPPAETTARAVSEVVQDFVRRGVPLELRYPGKNLGYGGGHNLVIPASTLAHEYHLICNPDISLGEHTLECLYAFMESHPEVGLCMPKLQGPDGKTQYCCRRSPVALDYVSQLILPRTWGKRRRDALELRGCDYDQTMEVPCLSGCFMFFRSEVLHRLGGFDERFFLYFEDFDLSLRARSLGSKNVYLPHTWVVHERQSAHRSSLRLKARFMASACRYFAKWGWFTSRVNR